MQLDCPTHDDNEKALTVDALKEEILVNSSEDTLKRRTKNLCKSQLKNQVPTG